MAVLPITIAPHPIFKQKAEPINTVDVNIQQLADNMFETLYHEHAVGLGANMLGILKQIAVIDLQENNKNNPICLINPQIIWASDEQQSFKEASLSFPGIDATITRPKYIKLSYLDREGVPQEMEASGYLATVIQHEVDYLNGIVFLDYLSKMKQNMLLKKMDKYKKLNKQ